MLRRHVRTARAPARLRIRGTTSASTSSTTDLSRFRTLLGDRRAVGILVASSVLAGLAESAIVALVTEAAAALVNGSRRIRLDLGAFHSHVVLGALFGVAVALALLRLGLQVVVSLVPARISADAQDRLRSELYAAFTRASWGIQSGDKEGLLQELMSSQIVNALGGVLQATTLVIALITFLVLILSAFALNPLAAAVVLLAAVALFALLRPVSTLVRRRASETSMASVALATRVNESVRVAEETNVFGTEEAQRQLTSQMIAQLRAPFFQYQFVSRLVPGVYQSLVYILVIGALAGVYASGAHHVGSLGAVVLLLVRAGTYGQGVQTSYQSVRSALPYLERIEQARERYAASAPAFGKRQIGTLRTIAFERVSFAYAPELPVLSEIDFDVGSGEAVGIVGPSGAGKSTLIQLLLRLRPPDSGRYLVNGRRAGDFDADEWHRRVAYVPQAPQLLHASVADNIRFLRDFDDAAVERAARLAAVHDEIVSWPAGYDTIVGPRADAVSGGQQQRICIARALVSRPDLLVLDEPTSALDPHSEAVIQASLGALAGSLTLFVAAHRMSTLAICQRVMVIVDGRLEGFDTTEQLERRGGYYHATKILAGKPASNA